MIENPLVSVIMPAFNAERYIEESVNSIVHQNYKNWELIIINDGSSDSTQTIIQNLAQKDSRIKIFENEGNKGIVYTRNRGLKEVTGKYVANLDSDDIAFPNRLSTQVAFLEKNLNYIMVGSGCELIDANGVNIGRESREIEDHKLKSLLVFSNYFINSSVLYRREVIGKLCYEEDGTDLAQDYQFFTKLSLEGGIGNIDEPLIQYRIHNENVSTKKAEAQRGRAKKIQLNQLRRLEIEVSAEELELHNQLVDTSVELQEEEVDKVEKWLLKLKTSNREKKIYDVDSFDYWCSFFYQRACLKAKKRVKSYALFHESELSRGYKEGLKSNLTFFVKSIFKKV